MSSSLPRNAEFSLPLQEPLILAQLRQETAQRPGAQMQIAPEQGQLLALLVQLLKARKTLEIGVFTGYSALAVALVLPDQGKLIACDINVATSLIAQRYWKQAGVADKIELRLAPALETLQSLLQENHAGSFDFVFIDADKRNYDAYYEYALQLTRPGGLIVIDNTLWYGRVVDRAVQDKQTLAIRTLNQKLHTDERITLSLIPIADGLTLAWKR
jgi:predicted O-methyltransferase YrrM